MPLSQEERRARLIAQGEARAGVSRPTDILDDYEVPTDILDDYGFRIPRDFHAARAAVHGKLAKATEETRVAWSALLASSPEHPPTRQEIKAVALRGLPPDLRNEVTIDLKIDIGGVMASSIVGCAPRGVVERTAACVCLLAAAVFVCRRK